MNITMIYMRTNFLLAASSFLSMSLLNQNQEINIFTSHFAHSFSNIVYSCSINYQMKLMKNVFIYSLNSSIFLAEAENTELTYQNFKTSLNFNQYSKYGNITIINCIFEQCISEVGGGICVLQKCTILIHGTLFNQCRAKDGGGGFIGALYKYRNDNHDSSEFLLSVIVQYCCFNQCFAQYYSNPRVMGFGSCLILSSEKTLILYISSYNSTYNNENTYGAQFDTYSSNISTKYFNTSNTIATFSGSVEYRLVQTGSFQFNTIAYLESKYTTYFSLFGKMSFSNCNFIANYVRGNPNGVNLPALICQDIKSASYLTFIFDIVDCFFYKNVFAERCSITQTFTNKGKITLVNCFSDKYTITGVDNINTVSCNLNFGDNLIVSLIPHINLGQCEGDHEVPDFFSPSFLFSCSNLFTFSQKFSFSNEFSLSILFSKSKIFTNSNQFSISNEFSFSSEFSETDVFSSSDQFSFSSKFSETNAFSSSDQFSFSSKFSETDIFSNSDQFTSSNSYSMSSFFSKSNQFSNSNEFSDSLIHMTSLSGNYILSLTISITFVLRRSVSFSLSFSISNSLSCLFLNNSYSMTNTQYYYPWPFPYIINYLSQSYIETYVPIFIFKKKKITGEQLIGIVCGSTSIFFIILGIIILSLKKREKEFDEYDLSDDECTIENTVENKDDNKDDMNNSNNSSDHDLNFWL